MGLYYVLGIFNYFVEILKVERKTSYIRHSWENTHFLLKDTGSRSVEYVNGI